MQNGPKNVPILINSRQITCIPWNAFTLVRFCSCPFHRRQLGLSPNFQSLPPREFRTIFQRLNRQIGRAKVVHLQNHCFITNENDFPAVYMTFWSKPKINLQKSRADVFQVYSNAIHFNTLQICTCMSLLGFPAFRLSSSLVLSRYRDI